MYSWVRIIFLYVLLFNVVVLIFRFNKTHFKKYCIIAVALSLILCTLSMFIPIENLFITFDSPQKAYRYVNGQKDEIELIVEGEDCDFVVGNNRGTRTYLSIPKQGQGWKIGLPINTKMVNQKIAEGIVIEVYQYKHTDDYFLTVLNTNGGEISVCDDVNTVFYPIREYNEVLGESFITYVGHISSLHSSYSLEINGSKISLIS